MRRNAAVALTIAAVAMVVVPGRANAQDDTVAERVDARLSRIDRVTDVPERFLAGEGGTPQRVPPFTLSFSGPFTYNSNVENSESGRKDAFHYTPSMIANYKQSAGAVRFFARMGADLDEYTEHSENSGSTVHARFGLRVHTDSLGGLVPYLHYTPVLAYGSGFNDHQLTLHTFTLGAAGEFPLGSTTLSLDLNVARREATSAVAERNQGTAVLELAGDIGSTGTSWSIGATLQGRYYTGGTNEGRDDLNLITTAGISIPVADRATLDIGVSLEQNFSDVAGKDYTTFDAGPSVNLRVPFG